VQRGERDASTLSGRETAHGPIGKRRCAHPLQGCPDLLSGAAAA
jgi:hypothetical protein